MAETLTGMGVVPGIAIGRAAVWCRTTLGLTDKPAGTPEDELSRLSIALERTGRQLKEIMQNVAARIGETEARIFKTHLALLGDPMLLKPVREQIANCGLQASKAVAKTIEHLTARLEASSTPRLRERAADLKDIGTRILCNLSGEVASGACDAVPGILCASYLAPSEISLLDREKVLGIALEEGGSTSHAVILAKALGIPTVVGVRGLMARVQASGSLVLDGQTGEVVVDPDAGILEFHRRRSKVERCARAKLDTLKALRAVTLDGCSIEIGANIGRPEEATAALNNGADGIGLFRTEFLFLDRETSPPEEEQFAAYSETLALMAPRRVIIRTADIGADKQLRFMKLSPEPNPALGLRAIRLSLKEEAFFSSQIRALLRASCFGNLAILLPMVTDVVEIRQIREIIGRVRRELEGKGVKIADSIPIGAMVETPSAALMAKVLACEVDFFSIGTNDLTQYVLAADRLNKEVAYLYQPFHPAVLWLIQEVARAAAQHGKWLGICGEAASDPLGGLLFVGMGIDELSMSPALIPAVKDAIRRIKKSEAAALAKEALEFKTGSEVVERLKHFADKRVGADVCSSGADL